MRAGAPRGGLLVWGMTPNGLPKRWWLPPLLWTAAFLAVLIPALVFSATAREVAAKGLMNILGLLATPFILETVTALAGLALVLAWNQWRIQKDGDGWVYLAKTEPDPASLAAGADKAEHRLAAVVLAEKPDSALDFEARLAVAEGYLELGLGREALEHLDMLAPDEQAHERAAALRVKAASLAA
ncbi:MAG TPA: hypothetical protein DIT64_03435 [Verrucomicrobiales bacterium]|nr:hypothetical protein [Verrucomicrobiales bacterium]